MVFFIRPSFIFLLISIISAISYCFVKAQDPIKKHTISDVIKNSKNKELIKQWYLNDELDEDARKIVEKNINDNINQGKTISNGEKINQKDDNYKERYEKYRVDNCHFHPSDPYLYEKIMKFKKDNAVLLEYEFYFPDFENTSINPFDVGKSNLSFVYQSDKWSRVLSKHGRILLSLSFHYDLVSLWLLRLGVHKLRIGLFESTPNCSLAMDVEERLTLIRKLILDDFRVFEKTKDVWLSKEESACFQIVENNDGYANFEYSCCTRTLDDGRESCKIIRAENWILVINRLLYTLKIALLFFGPLMLQQWVYSDSIRKTDYIVRLPERLIKTIMLRRIKMKDNGKSTDTCDSDENQQFRIFRKLLQDLPADHVVKIAFKKLHILVDQKQLMSEQSIPVGLLHTFYENLFRCQYRFVDPFSTCCKESIFGSWYPKFLWLKLGPKSQCNLNCRQYLSWGHVARVIGGLLLLTAISTPYILRVVIYYMYESDRVEKRNSFRKELGLKKSLDGSVLQYLTPSHPALVTSYVIYCISLLLLAFFRACDSEKFDNIARGCIQDLRSISRIYCFRLILAHLLLPIEKFGICCGIFIGCLYWPIVFPICIIITIIYCVPLFYMTGRFLIPKRPVCFRNLPTSSPHRTFKRKSNTVQASISDGATSFESALLLNKISRQDNSAEDTSIPNAFQGYSMPSNLITITVSVCCIAVMYCLMLMFAESVGFLIEIVVFSIFGAILNVGRAAVFICLFFWTLLYTVRCYNSVYNKYMNLNRALFKMITKKLNASVRDSALLREDGINTAEKYFSVEELRNEYMMEVNLEREEVTASPVLSLSKINLDMDSDTIYDSIEYRDGKLHWYMLNTVLFIDHKDRPMIPKKLFESVCQVEAPGCPGPIYQSLVLATRQLLYMLMFLAFIGSIIWGIGLVYEIPPLLQLCAILAAGFIPLIIRYVIHSRNRDKETVHLYSLEGKIQQIIRHFHQIWPVYDLSFKILSENDQQHIDDGETTSPKEEIQSSPDPTHVDLLISVRDDGIPEASVVSDSPEIPPNNLISNERQLAAAAAAAAFPSETNSSYENRQMVDLVVDFKNKNGQKTLTLTDSSKFLSVEECTEKQGCDTSSV